MNNRPTRLRQRATPPDARSFGRYRRAIEQRTAPSTTPLRFLAALALLGNALVVVGAFAPWKQVPAVGPKASTSLRGMETDGILVAVGSFAVALARPAHQLAALIGLGAIGTGTLIGGLSWLVFDQAIAGYEAMGQSAETEWGLPFVTVAGLAGTLVAWLHYRRIVNS